ncbi:hypothetical protein J5N97_016275 [Dioscorea zingiberensis]|uniref:Proline-rich protein n=1 Tax=Dioscorea zingiberensis TaxID=325984 RepID=A0A9D5HF95_9LILI|nr:hypothetical protein J5N97_016275 [Dioscorea zingiberensis]
MAAPLPGGRVLVLFVVALLCLISFISCSAVEKESEVFAAVVGATQCLDCVERNIKLEHAFKGLKIVIKCKTNKQDYKIKATSELNQEGKFTVKLPTDIIGDSGELKTECFAQLHDASNTPCPHQNPLNPSNILLQSKDNAKLTYGTASKLPFSSSTCTSAFLIWHYFHDHHHPMYKKPTPTPSPTPVYKPQPPEKKPCPPVYKKPIYVPKYPPVYKKPMPPIYKKPHPKYGWPPMPPFSHHHKHPFFPPSKEVAPPSP